MNAERYESPVKLIVAERAPIDPAQRRTHPRFAVELDLSLGEEHKLYAGLVENVSVGGVFIATHLCRSIGEHVQLTIHLPESETPVRGLGEVRWVRAWSEVDNTPPGMGIRFLELQPGSREAIEQFLSRHQGAALGPT